MHETQPKTREIVRLGTGLMSTSRDRKKEQTEGQKDQPAASSVQNVHVTLVTLSPNGLRLSGERSRVKRV